jgi:putative transposase
MVFRSYKYRLYPTTEQKTAFAKHFGCARFVYNWALAKKIEAYQKERKTLSRFALQRELPSIKKSPEYCWLAEVNSQSLQASLENLDKAFRMFFRDRKGFPKFKKKRIRQSFQVPQNARVNFESGTLTLPKIGPVKAVFHRTFEGTIKTVTVSRATTGNYFASILVETSVSSPPKPSMREETAIGIDLGVKHFATLSTGEKVGNPKYLKRSLKRLKRLQRRVSRKCKGSKNREKARLRLAKFHERITNQRLDFLHKLTYRLTHENQVDTICLENLNVAGMMQNHPLAQAISDVSWAKFVGLLTYKADWYGKNIVFIGRFEPSSRLCTCGYVNQVLTLREREWTCPNCGTVHDRDMLAANNIRRFAFQTQDLLGRDTPEVTLGETVSVVEPRSLHL